MSALMLSNECSGDERAFHPIFGPMVSALGPRHEDCPGGETRPGVLGGWDCSCECHVKDPSHA